ncbi:hypothetical protein HHK36_005429 [Tetracentron sinense]|uniref:Uncharacterized protein n=1 Tax=Tetracentron sinense TaxID=13715 RepID=A0A835DQQ0_TETSI|nr:hypothetical protein HHK36_005429 [Tetracentron sinense]
MCNLQSLEAYKHFSYGLIRWDCGKQDYFGITSMDVGGRQEKICRVVDFQKLTLEVCTHTTYDRWSMFSSSNSSASQSPELFSPLKLRHLTDPPDPHSYNNKRKKKTRQ